MKEMTLQSSNQTVKPSSHNFNMTDRKKAALTGVTKVDSSNATELILTTALGRLEVRGSELKIVKFDVSDGDLTFTGNVDSIKYAVTKPPLLKRIFK